MGFDFLGTSHYLEEKKREDFFFFLLTWIF